MWKRARCVRASREPGLKISARRRERRPAGCQAAREPLPGTGRGKSFSSLKGFEGSEGFALRWLFLASVVMTMLKDASSRQPDPRRGSPSRPREQGAVCARWDWVEMNAMGGCGVSPGPAPQPCSLHGGPQPRALAGRQLLTGARLLLDAMGTRLEDATSLDHGMEVAMPGRAAPLCPSPPAVIIACSCNAAYRLITRAAIKIRNESPPSLPSP